MTINHLFEDYAKNYPDHIAVLCGKESLSYGALNKKANQLAHYLQKKGVRSDKPIALCLERSVDFLIAILAILKAGGGYLPIDEAQPEERLLFLLKDSAAPILITKSAAQGKFAAYPGTLVLLDTDEKEIKRQAKTNPSAAVAPDNLAYVIYTSGSTGTPKGVLIEHRSVINYCQWFAQYTGCKAQQRIDFSSSPIFDMAVSVSLIPLMLGLTVVLCADKIKKDARPYLQYLADSRINIMKLTPSYFKVLVQESKNHFIALPLLKSIILGGENLTAKECQSWIQLYPEHVLFNEYGPTETTVAVSVHEVNHSNCANLDANVPIGRTGIQMSCIILDANLNPLPNGQAGELFIGGTCLARGYLNQPELTRKQFIKDSLSTRLYKTGDLCQIRADGVIEYLGRIDDQVKIRGFRVEPGEVEKHLAHYAGFKTVAVIAQKDTLDEQRLVAYYILKEGYSTPNTKLICEFLQQHVPDYMIPAAFIKINSLPLTANGKLDKAALPLPRFESSQNYVEPVTDLEKKLAQSWAEELGVKSIGLNDNFFELGGHSLSAARIISKLNHELEKNITLYDFYLTATIANLIPVIKKTKKIKQQKSTLSAMEYKELTNTPLSDFQFMLWMSNTFEPRAKKLNIVARKRLQGRLNKAALELAFQVVLKKHEVFIYRILKFQPAQQVQKNLSFQLIEKNLESLSALHSEKELHTSMIELIDFYPWPKKAPLLMARLFHLSDDTAELQICMPHLISDDASIDILFADLSKFYLLYSNQLTVDTIETDTLYKQYVFSERDSINASLDKNIIFWEEYLKDTSLFSFPEKYIVNDMKAQKLPYSTYAKIPKHTMENLKNFCEQNHISINNGLCAILALALRKCCDDQPNKMPYTLMNIVKSTRENPIYDYSIGCFLRVEPIKIALDNASTVETLSKQIRQSTIDTSNYQQCSNLIKLSSISTFSKKKQIIQNFFVGLLTPIYTKILQIPPVYHKILQRCGGKLISFKRNNSFLINLNVHNSFIADTNKHADFFGLKTKQIKSHKEDLLTIDYIFEAGFFCDDDRKTYYLAISANLHPSFRELIAKEVIFIMDTVTSEHPPFRPSGVMKDQNNCYEY